MVVWLMQINRFTPHGVLVTAGTIFCDWLTKNSHTDGALLKLSKFAFCAVTEPEAQANRIKNNFLII